MKKEKIMLDPENTEENEGGTSEDPCGNVDAPVYDNPGDPLLDD